MRVLLVFQRYERLVRKLPPLIIFAIVGFGFIMGMPWALGTRGTLELSPASVTLTLWAGESTSYPVTIHNGLGEQVTVALHVSVFQAPAGGNALDLQVSYPTRVTLGPGNALVAIHLQVQGQAAPGTYSIGEWMVQT